MNLRTRLLGLLRKSEEDLSVLDMSKRLRCKRQSLTKLVTHMMDAGDIVVTRTESLSSGGLRRRYYQLPQPPLLQIVWTKVTPREQEAAYA